MRKQLKRIGIYGGSFDPVHNGHLITVSSVLEQRDLEKVYLVPAYISPFKLDSKSSDEKHRIAMLKYATSDLHYFDISLFEIDKKGVSYTIDTLKHFQQLYDEIDLIIGYDNMVEFDKWKCPDEIMAIANVVVMKRSIDNTEKSNEFMQSATYVNTPTIDISSTIIRERVKNKLPVDSLVPDVVKDYILKNKLYLD